MLNLTTYLIQKIKFLKKHADILDIGDGAVDASKVAKGAWDFASAKRDEGIIKNFKYEVAHEEYDKTFNNLVGDSLNDQTKLQREGDIDGSKELNREIEKRLDPRPRMSDYAESGEIEQTAQSAMFVFYGHNFDNERYSPYNSELIVSKCRYGRIGTHKIGFNGGRCKFYMNQDMAQGDVPKNGS